MRAFRIRNHGVNHKAMIPCKWLKEIVFIHTIFVDASSWLYTRMTFSSKTGFPWILGLQNCSKSVFKNQGFCVALWVWLSWCWLHRGVIYIWWENHAYITLIVYDFVRRCVVMANALPFGAELLSKRSWIFLLWLDMNILCFSYKIL
jgi:hypothetical protein